MMSGILKKASFLAVLWAMTSPVLAQGPGGGRGGFGGGFEGRGGSAYRLLGNPAVQEELALSDEQKSEARSLLDAMRKSLESSMGDLPDRESFRDLSPEERRERMASMRKDLESRGAKVQEEYRPKFAELLDEVQLQRLNQIHWQAQGPRALQDEDLAKALGLSQEQKDKIRSIFEENRGQGFGGSGGRGPGARRPGGFSPEDREAMRAEMQARMEKLNDNVKGVLTDAQREELARQLGESFDLAKLRGPGVPGGPDFRGPGGPGGRGPGGDGFRRPGGDGFRGPGGDGFRGPGDQRPEGLRPRGENN